ncbi:hypothetical protein BC938DRAFT_477962 [Jimgerdemannia flammicorona]|uniref:Uncharacterized protein n=1 Tax=Jimgerdemannia flammicorona TaxID=994334 RepID=A0A433P700_9FUNG|nr:hypothetical protein BC938DRAFT_477962 [Jimgerdemannia flammicorona]
MFDDDDDDIDSNIPAISTPPTIHLDDDTHNDLLLSLRGFHALHPVAPPPSPQEPSLLDTVFQHRRKRSSSAPAPFLPAPSSQPTMPKISEVFPISHYHNHRHPIPTTAPPAQQPHLFFAHAKTLDELLRTIASNPNTASPRITKLRNSNPVRQRLGPATSPSRIPVAASRLRPCVLMARERRSSAGGGGGRGCNGTGLHAPPSSPSVSLSASGGPSAAAVASSERGGWLRRASVQRKKQIAHAAGLVQMLKRREISGAEAGGDGGGTMVDVEEVGQSGTVVENLISELRGMGL